jgi:hypothetical protein
MAGDKKTIGITRANAAALTELERAGRFGSELDAAKFAMAFAIRSGVRQGSTEGAETKWNVGSVDPDGSVRSLVEALCPDVAEPYRLVEHLMNEGITMLKNELSGGADLYDVMFPAKQAS